MEKNLTDAVKATPGGFGLRGEVTVPGDKSISHRAVILGSIADGVTEVDGFLEGADNLATVDAFRAMGVEVERTGPLGIRVKGVGIRGLMEPEDVLDARNSGTTARLLTGLLSAQNFFSVITGDNSLRTRPMGRVVEPLLDMGASICGRKGATMLPLAISPGTLVGIRYSTPVPSAQLKSALLLAGLYARGETVVTEGEKSRDHTERMLGLFGAEVKVHDRTVSVKPAQSLKACRIKVPGDLSSAAFFIVGALITPGSEILIRDVGVNPTRTGIIEILRKMGGKVEIREQRDVCGEPVAEILVKSSELTGVSVGAKELLPAIDEFPALCVAAAFAKGSTTVAGARELRVKDSDRISAMSVALNAIGVRSTQREDGITIDGVGEGEILKGSGIRSLGDHRIAMAMAIAALRTDSGVDIHGSDCVEVSFPGFFSSLEGIKAR